MALGMWARMRCKSRWKGDACVAPVGSIWPALPLRRPQIRPLQVTKCPSSTWYSSTLQLDSSQMLPLLMERVFFRECVWRFNTTLRVDVFYNCSPCPVHDSRFLPNRIALCVMPSVCRCPVSIWPSYLDQPHSTENGIWAPKLHEPHAELRSFSKGEGCFYECNRRHGHGLLENKGRRKGKEIT